jgi:TRAP-type mannitol/chloroaromatic compound transport system permease small subunit
VINNRFMWGCVRGLEGFANTVGRIAAWAGLLMVIQQIVIIFMQRVFAVAEISIGFGATFTKDVSWWSEELKFYNAMIVCLCAAYTFVQGGHVRVDLVYSAISYRAKRVVDMVGSMVFMVPAGLIIWLYGWFFMWRHLVVPNPSASDTLDRLLTKARALRWNIETIGFSPNGFNAYFMFKVLLVVFVLMILLQAVAFLYRSYLEFKEGPESEGKFLDKDQLGDPTAELVADIH